MANKYVLTDADEAAREEGVTQAVTGVQRTGEVEKTTYDYTKSIYAKETGAVTNRESLLKKVNVAPEEFYKYYEDNKNYIPAGYEETARVLAIESKRAADYARVEAGEVGFEDFLMDTYGKDLLKSEGINLADPMYWYNRYKEGYYDNPLDNDTVYMGVLEQANNLFQEDSFLQSINSTKISDTLVAEEVEGLVGDYITSETFADVFPDVSETMLEAMDNDMDTFLSYYRAGYLNGIFKPYVDVDGDGEYEYALYTDGKLYKVSEKDQWLFSDTVQINYKKDSAGNYVLNEDGTRKVDSIEKGGLFGTSDFSQFLNQTVASFAETFTSIVDIFGLAYAGIAGAIDANKTFGDYYVDYEALKNSELGFVLSLGTKNTILYDEGEQTTALKFAAGIGTVLGMVTQVALAVASGGATAAAAGAGAAAKSTAKITAGAIMKRVGMIAVKGAVGAIAGAAVGAGVAGITGTDVQQGTISGAIIGAGIGIGWGAFGGTAPGASIGQTAKSGLAKFWQLGNRMRQGTPWSAAATTLTRASVWSSSLQSALMLGVRDGVESYATLSAGNRVRQAVGMDEMTMGDMLGKAVLTGALSFGTSALLRAAQGNSFTMRAASVATAKKGEEAFLQQILKMSSGRLGSFLSISVDTVADLAENFITMGISSWGRDYLNEKQGAGSVTEIGGHIVSAMRNPTSIMTSLYMGLNNYGVLRRVTGQKSIAAENYEAAVGTLARIQKRPLADTKGIIEMHLARMPEDKRADAMDWYEKNIVTAQEQAYQEFKDAGTPDVNEMTVALRTLELMDEKLEAITGNNYTSLAESAKAYLESKISEYKAIRQSTRSTAEGATARNEIGYYKRALENINSIIANKGTSNQQMSLVGALFGAYVKDNQVWAKREKYNALMQTVQEHYNSYDKFITMLRNGVGEETFREYLTKCGGDLSKFYGKLLNDIKKKTVGKLDGLDPAYKTRIDLYNSELFTNGEALVRRALDEAYKSLFMYYSPEMIDLQDQEINKLMDNASGFFTSGAINKDTVRWDDKLGKYVYDVPEFMKTMLSNKENVEKMVKLGILAVDGNGYTCVLQDSVFMRVNQSARNEMLKNKKVQLIVKIMDLMADVFENSYSDFERPVLTRFTTTYKNSDGTEMQDYVYIIPSFSTVELTQNMSLVPAYIQCVYNIISPRDMSKVNTSLIRLGTMFSQDTAFIESTKIFTEAEQQQFKQLGLLTLMRYFNIGEKDATRLASNNIVDRSTLLELFNTSHTDANGNILPPVLTLKDLDATMKLLEGTGPEAQAFGSELIKNNINDLRIYAELYAEAKEVDQIISRHAIKKDPNKKLSASEIEKIKTFIVSCKDVKNKDLYQALIDDGVFKDSLVTFIEKASTNVKGNFQGGHEVTGEIVRRTSEVISERLVSNGYNIQQDELESLIRNIYTSLTGGVETTHIKDYTLSDTVTAQRDSYHRANRRARYAVKKLDVYENLSKENQKIVSDYLYRALRNPDILNLDTPEYKAFIQAGIDSGVPKEFRQIEDEINKQVNKLADNALKSFAKICTVANGKAEIEDIYKLYKDIGGKDMTLDEFKQEWESLVDIKRNSTKQFIINTLQKTKYFKNLYPTAEEIHSKVSQDYLLEVVQNALNLKYSAGTFGINPTHIVTVDLTEFATKEFSDIAEKLKQIARLSSEFKNDKFDDDVRKLCGGLTPYHQQILGNMIAKGTTKISFDLRSPQGRLDFNKFMESVGYAENAATYKPEIPGVRYSEEIERGIELKLETLDANGKVIPMTPLEILNKIRENINNNDESNPHRIQYVTTSTEERKEKFSTRMDAVAQDIVYIDDSTIISNITDLLINAPYGDYDLSGINTSYHSIGLSVKQGVSAGRLAKYIKTAQQTLGANGSFDTNLELSLQMYGIAEATAEYFTDPKNFGIAIKQQFATQQSYDEAVNQLTTSNKLYQTVPNPDTLEIVIIPNRISKDEFMNEALRIMNSSDTFDIRKILPYFVYQKVGGGKYTTDSTGAIMFESEEYQSLTKGGTEWSSMGDTGNVFTALNYVMNRVNLTVDELETILTTVNAPRTYTLGKGNYAALEGKTAKEIIDICSTSTNMFERALSYALRTGIAISDSVINKGNISNNTNLNRALGDLSTRVYLGQLFDRYDGDVDKIYEELQRTDTIPSYKESDKFKEYITSDNINTTALRTITTDNSIDPKSLTLDDIKAIADLMQGFNTSSPEQIKYALIKNNPLLNVHNALEIVDGKLAIKLDMLYRLSKAELDALESIGFRIGNLNDIVNKRDAYLELDERFGPTEIKALAALENQTSNSMTTYGLTHTEFILKELAMNRLRKPNNKMYVKASSIMNRLEDSQVANLINGYIAKINNTVMRTVNNYGSLQLFNFNSRESLAEFMLGIRNGTQVLKDIPITSPDGTVQTDANGNPVKLIKDEHLYDVSETIMLYTNGVGYSSEFTNTFIYNRETGEITPFSQHIQGDLDFGRQLSKRSDIYGDESKNLVLIRVDKNVFTEINNPENKIKLYDLSNEDTRNSLKATAVAIANDALETRYRNSTDIPDNLKDRLAYVYGKVVTRKDKYERIADLYQKRIGGNRAIPEAYSSKLFPMVENIQVSGDGLNLREEAFFNTLHKQIIGDGHSILSDENLRELNDLAIYAITLTAMPEELQDSFLDIQTRMLNNPDSPEQKFVDAYLKGDMELARRIYAESRKGKTLRKQVEDLQVLTYTLMINRLQGKDINAILMNGKTFKTILADTQEDIYSNIKISTDGTNEVPLRQVMESNMIAFDTESIFRTGDNAENNYKDSLPTELSFVIANQDTTKGLTARGQDGTKIQVYIKPKGFNVDTIQALDKLPRDSVSSDTFLYTTTEALNNYKQQIAKLEGNGTKLITEGNSIIFIIDGDVVDVNSTLKNFLDNQFSIQNIGSDTHNFISYNGKSYDDTILTKLGLDKFKTNVDLYELLQTIYSGSINNTTSLKQEHLESLIDLKGKYGIDPQNAHTASHDALVLLAIAEDFFTKIEDVNDYTKALKYDIVDIARIYLDYKGTDEELLKLLQDFTNRPDYNDTGFDDEIKATDGFKNQNTFIQDYQTYGDSLTNEILMETRNAYNDLLNDYELSSIRGKRTQLLSDIADRDLDFIRLLTNPEFREEQRDLISNLYTLVKSINAVAGEVTEEQFLKYDPNTKVLSGYLVDASTVLTKIIEAYKQPDESFSDATKRFFSLSNGEQVATIQRLAEEDKAKPYKDRKIRTGLQKDADQLLDRLSNFEITKQTPTQQGTVRPEEFNKFVDKFFENGYNSVIENIRRDTNAISISYQVAHAIDPVFKHLFDTKDSIYYFLDDETKTEMKRLLVTWYGQTPEQVQRQISRDAQRKDRKPIVESIFNSLMFGEAGYETNDRLSSQILTAYKDRIKGAVTYDKLRLLPDNKYEDGVIYLSKDKFESITGVTYEQALLDAYGTGKTKGKYIYMEANRQPSFKQDVIHNVPVVVIDDKKAGSMNMTLNTAQHFFMGDNDGDMVCLRYSRDICQFGDKIANSVNTAMSMLTGVTRNISDTIEADLPPKTRKKIFEYKTGKITVEDSLKIMYDSINREAADADDTVNTVKTLITKTMVENNVINAEEAKTFWAYYGVEKVDIRNTDATGDTSMYVSYSTLIDKDSLLAKNLVRSKQYSSQFFNIMSLRDTAGQIQKDFIKIGEKLDLDNKERPYVYTPLNLEPSTKVRIDKSFEDDTIRTSIVSSLTKSLEANAAVFTDVDFTLVRNVLNRADDFKDNGSTYVATVIQLTQDIITTSKIYADTIKNAYAESSAPTEAYNNELAYYNQLKHYAKSRGIDVPDEDLTGRSIFEIQNKSAVLLDQSLEINRAAADYNSLFESASNDKFENLLFNVFMERYSETEDKHILYCDSYGNPSLVRDPNTSKVYVNSQTFRVLISDKVEDNALYVTGNVKDHTISNVVTSSIPKGQKITRDAMEALINKKPLRTTFLHTGCADEPCEPYYIVGAFTKNGKATTDVDSVDHIVISHRHSIAQSSPNTVKMSIPGSGMGKGLVITDTNLIPSSVSVGDDIDIVMHPNMLKGTKYNPASGTLQGQKLDSDILTLPFTVVEDNSDWNKNLKLRPTDNITITNGRMSAEGMLTVGQYTFEVNNGRLTYNTEGVAKISSLLKNKYSKDYNNTNAAKVYQVMRVAAVLKEIPDSEWQVMGISKQEMVNNITFNANGGSDTTSSVLNTLIRKFFPGEKLQQLRDKLESDPVTKTLFSKEMEDNFNTYYLDGVKPGEGMGAKNKRDQTKSINKKDKLFVKGTRSGEFVQLLENQTSSMHDNTFGHFDTLSFFNELAIALGQEPVRKGTATEATKNKVVPTGSQFAGSQPNGFVAIDEDNAIKVQESLMNNRGTTKTDFSNDETPSLFKNVGDLVILTDEQLTAYGKTVDLDNRNLARNNYKPALNLDAPEKLPALHKRVVLSYMLGLMKHTGNDALEIAEAFNSNYPNVIVNASPKTIQGNRGELQLGMIPETETVPLRDATSTMYKHLTPTDFHKQQKSRTDELKQAIDNNNIAKAAQNTEAKLTLDEQFQKLLDESSNLNTQLNPYAYKSSERYQELTTRLNQMEAGIESFISQEEQTRLQQVFDLDIKNNQLKRSWLRSSGIKGSYAVDRALVQYRNSVKMYLANIAGNEYGTLVKLFTNPVYSSNYKEFNKMVYGMMYMEKFDTAEANMRSTKKTNLSYDLWDKAQQESLKFFKDNFGLEKISDISKIKQDIELFAKTNNKTMSAIQTVISRMSAMQSELDRAEGKPAGMAFTLLIDKAVAKEVRENKLLSRDDINVIDMADNKVDIINTIGEEMDFLAKRAAVAQYTNLLKQDGRMANAPVIAKATQLTDEALTLIKALPDYQSGSSYTQENKLARALFNQAQDLLPNVDPSMLGSKVTMGQKLAYLYEEVRNEIERNGVQPYSELEARLALNPEDLDAKNQLDRMYLLNSIMGTIAYTTSKSPKSAERTKVLNWFSTKVFDDFMKELDTSRYTLVDKNGRMLFKTNKDGSISFSDVYSSTSMPFLTVEDACIYMLKYDKDVINNPDDKANSDEIKFNIVAGMMNGDIYVTDKVIAEEFGHSQLGLFQNKSMPVKFYKKIAQKLRNIKSALIMSNPIRLVDRIVSQHAFDFGTFARNDLGAFAKIPQAKREINQVRASKGASMSENMKLFMDASGYMPGSRKVAGEENLEAINQAYFKFTNEMFNTQHFESRYAAFLSLMEATMANGGNIPANKAGSAYYMLDEINNYNPVNRGLSAEENAKRNAAVKCMSIISEAIGTSGDMPGIARQLGEYGFMFTTFPLACMRGGVGKLKSLSLAVKRSFDASADGASARKYLLSQTGNMLAATAATILITLLTSEGQEAAQQILDKDEETEEEKKEIFETISKYFLSGATIQPVQSMFNGELSGSEYQNTSIGASLYNMFVDPYVEAYMDDNEDTHVGTATWRVLMENVWSHAPAGKDLIESIPSNSTLQSLETYTNENNSFFENFFRKIGGYAIGSAPSNAAFDSFKADTYADEQFLAKLKNGYDAAIQEAFGNNKKSKSDWRTYTKASSIIYDFKVVTGDTYSGSDDWDDELYSSIKKEYTLLMKTGKSPQDIYDLIIKHLEEGTPVAYVRSAIRNCSLTYKLEQIDQDALINYVSESELNVIRQALLYEQTVFPFLQEYIDDLNDIYEEQSYQNYYDNYGSYPTPVTNAQRQASYLLNYYKTYNNYSNYNNKVYYNTPYSINYYRRQDYSDTPLDIFKNLQDDKEYQQRQYEYQRNQRRWDD